MGIVTGLPLYIVVLRVTHPRLQGFPAPYTRWHVLYRVPGGTGWCARARRSPILNTIGGALIRLALGLLDSGRTLVVWDTGSGIYEELNRLQEEFREIEARQNGQHEAYVRQKEESKKFWADLEKGNPVV